MQSTPASQCQQMKRSPGREGRDMAKQPDTWVEVLSPLAGWPDPDPACLANAIWWRIIILLLHSCFNLHCHPVRRAGVVPGKRPLWPLRAFPPDLASFGGKRLTCICFGWYYPFSLRRLCPVVVGSQAQDEPQNSSAVCRFGPVRPPLVDIIILPARTQGPWQKRHTEKNPSQKVTKFSTSKLFSFLQVSYF